MGIRIKDCASGVPCAAPVQSLRVLVTVCLRTLCVRAQYESVLHLFENNSGPGSVYRLRLQSAHKPPGPPLLLYLVPEAIIGVCPLFFPLLPHEPVSHFPHCSRYCSRQRPFL